MLGFFDHLDNRRKAWAAFVGAAILFFIEAGLQVSGITSLPLAVTLWGIAGILFLYWLRYFAWAPGLQAICLGRVTAVLDWWCKWYSSPRLNPLATVAILLIAVGIGGAWLNNGRAPPGEHPSPPEKLSTRGPIVIDWPVGSLVWEYEKTSAIWDAAKDIYSETRTIPAARFAEANNATDDQILLWYCYAIINSAKVWGKRPPSDKFEELELRGFKLTQRIVGLSHYIEAPIPGFSASFIDLRVPKDSFKAIIDEIQAIKSKPDWAPTILTAA